MGGVRLERERVVWGLDAFSSIWLHEVVETEAAVQGDGAEDEREEHSAPEGDFAGELLPSPRPRTGRQSRWACPKGSQQLAGSPAEGREMCSWPLD